MAELLEFLKEYGSQLGVIGTAVTIIIGVFKYVVERREAHFWREFEVYHKLVRELVEPIHSGASMYVDRQAAIVFELKRFKRYRPYTLRMLIGLRGEWAGRDEKYPRLINEIDLAIEFMVLKEKRLCLCGLIGIKDR